MGERATRGCSGQHAKATWAEGSNRMSAKKNNFDAELGRAFLERTRALRALARKRGAQDDEDLVQDAFLKVVERSKRREIPTIDKFLSHVVGFLSIDRTRRYAFRSTYNRSEGKDGAVDAIANPERALMGAERLRRALAVIELMPPRRREVFLLHRIEEQTYAQIAKRLGVSIKAVEKHMHLAILQLSDADD